MSVRRSGWLLEGGLQFVEGFFEGLFVFVEFFEGGASEFEEVVGRTGGVMGKALALADTVGEAVAEAGAGFEG